MRNTDYIDYIRNEIKELETRDVDLLTTLVIESLTEMNGHISDTSESEIYNFIENEVKNARN